ncbi:MAG: peptidylprolyl isomerase [Novosphingobium sp.]|nr:peptidylprolyl isomerase [Novosphingobium sp.]
MTIISLALLAAAAAVTPDPRIIPLPLNPIIPASQRSCETKTASGLGYTALRAATGAKPAAGDVVLINYIGYLAAGGQTFDQATRAPLAVDQVVPGFSEGLKLIPIGAIYRLCIPASLGYGAKETGEIPANSDLVFQVEALDKKTMAEIQAMQAAAQQAAPPK